MAVKVKRYDSLDPGSWMTRPFTRTAEGFLTGRAIVTGIGVFTYLNKDGTASRELRLPEEVFASESLASMKLKPVTNDHPAEKVTPENAQELAVGTLGSNPSSTPQEYDYEGKYTPHEKLTDGLHVAIDMTISRADAIDGVLNGKRSLSMGYECEIETAAPGSVWLGMEYDSVQRNIRYNHCAIVDSARAGDAARIRMDGGGLGPFDAVQIYQSGGSRKTNPEVGKMGMKKISLDGVEYEGEEGLVRAYQEQKGRADSAEAALAKAKEDQAKALSSLQGERDAFKDRADKAERDLKEAKDAAADTKRLDEAVNAKLALMDAAARAHVEVKADTSDIDIKKAVIAAVYPAAKLDGRDEAYVAARFDAAVEDLDNRADSGIREAGGSLPASGGKDRNDSAAARQRMIDRLLARSRGEKEEG